MPLHATDKRARSFKNLANVDRTFYVRPGGSDDADGLTPATAFATLGAAIWEVEKDFHNGRYTIDITGCTIDEKLTFPQTRCGSFIRGSEARVAGNFDLDPTYWVMYKGGVNIRATPTVVVPIIPVTGLSYDGLFRSSLGLSPDLAFVASEHKNRFVIAVDATGVPLTTARMVPIHDNSETELVLPYVEQTNWLFGIGYVSIIEPGATVMLGVEEGRWTLDGIGGYVFSGIDFDLNGVDQSLVGTNCAHLLFEGCLFSSSTPATNRIRVGGVGLSRFICCSLREGVYFRLVGGSLQLYVFSSDTETLAFGSVDNIDTFSSPQPTQLTITSMVSVNFGTIDGRFGANVYLNKCDLDIGPIFDDNATGYITASRITNLELRSLSSVVLDGGEYTDTKVLTGGRLNRGSDANLLGTLTIGSLGPQPAGDVLVTTEDPTTGSVVYFP
jgi:hypothetical protein